jgi:FKBP-type peptidyl-prolyl cis-trans isomerase SlyD
MSERRNGSAPVVEDGLLVGLEYSLHLVDGAMISNSASRGPLVFVQGEGEVLAGLERALYGLAIGDEKVIMIRPEEAYGDRDPDAREIVPRSSFPSDMNLEPGMRILMRCDSGGRKEAYIEEVHADHIVLDLNHPLAGETLLIRIKVATIGSVETGELEHHV